jgi:hypothetical protein
MKALVLGMILACGFGDDEDGFIPPSINHNSPKVSSEYITNPLIRLTFEWFNVTS